MDYFCYKFGGCRISRFGFIVRTDRQNHITNALFPWVSSASLNRLLLFVQKLIIKYLFLSRDFFFSKHCMSATFSQSVESENADSGVFTAQRQVLSQWRQVSLSCAFSALHSQSHSCRVLRHAHSNFSAVFSKFPARSDFYPPSLISAHLMHAVSTESSSFVARSTSQRPLGFWYPLVSMSRFHYHNADSYHIILLTNVGRIACRILSPIVL